MGGAGSLLKSMIYSLDDNMRSIGRSIDVDHMEDIVKVHCGIGAASGVAAAALPGAGALVATSVAAGSVVTMYTRLAKALGVKLNEGLIRAVASAVVADVSASVLGNIAISAALSLIPGIGSLPSGIITGAANYGVVYLAALIFIKMLAAIFHAKKDISTMTADELIKMTKEISNDIDKKKAMKEASDNYKEEKKKDKDKSNDK